MAKENNIIKLLMIGIFIIFIAFLLYYYRKGVKHEGFLTDKYTNGKCCTEDEIQKCESYGKTGVCNYNRNDKSCLCQNALF